ncbi:MAG: DUF2177 family protein, partial [Pseudarthrobacter sp.]
MNTRTKRWLISYAVTAVIFAVLDLVWISFVASNLYQSQIGHLIAPRPNAAGAVAFYLIFVAGMVHYGVRPNDAHATMRQRVTGAALFGLGYLATRVNLLPQPTEPEPSEEPAQPPPTGPEAVLPMLK